MADIINKVNALGLLDQYTIAKSLGQEDEFCKAHDIDIEKGGKAATIGEIREFGGKKYQKQANGWRPVKKGSGEQNHLSPKQETAVSKLKEKHNSEYEVEHLGSGTHKISFKDGNQYVLNRDGEAGDVSDAAADKFSAQAELDAPTLSDSSKAKVMKVTAYLKKHGLTTTTNEINSAADGSDTILSPKEIDAVRFYFDNEPKTQPSSIIHIGDMSKEQKYAAAAKFGIANPEKLSTKELDKQLTDKNIEAELKKFKESKGSGLGLKPDFEGNFTTKEGESLFVRVYKDGGVKVEGSNVRKDFETTGEAEAYLNKVIK
jgi:hypothetical protein